MSKSNVSVKERGELRLNAFFTTLLEELDASEYRLNPGVQRQVQRARKKARFRREDLHDKAILKFLKINEQVGLFQKESPDLACLDRRIVENARYFVTTILERFTYSFDELAVQQPLEMSFLYSNWRFGPGTSNGVKGTHAAEKIWQEMTCTALCEPFVLKLRRSNPYFAAKDGSKGVTGTTIIEGSKLTTVPKNEDTERTIAIEPSGNMCLQLAAGMYLEGALKRIGLDIRTQQPKNKAMAKRGSESGDVATLDLASASDMISIDLVRALMPPVWFDLLMKLRSPMLTTKLNGNELSGDIQAELNMISTMGNGFTFPLMTLVIVALLYGFRCTRGGPSLFIDWTDTCVYGDDIIIPTHEYVGFVDVLTKAGLVVNLDKSYSEGSFRESCGGDYEHGVDITPFYVQSLVTEQDVYVVINQALLWGSREGIPLYRTLALLRLFIDGEPHLVPEWMSPEQGILTSGCPHRYSYLKREVVRSKIPQESEFFSIPLIAGGYCDAVGCVQFVPPESLARRRAPRIDFDPWYTPRSNKPPRVKVRRSRLPNGFLDGWDPGYRSQQASLIDASIISIVFGH